MVRTSDFDSENVRSNRTAPLILSFDSETHLIRPGLLAPPPVCFSFAWRREHDGVMDWGLCPKDSGAGRLASELADPDVVFLAHNAAFDFAVLAAYRPDLLPAIFAAYEAGRVRDTKIRAELIDVRAGRRQFQGRTEVFIEGQWVRADYSLAGLLHRYFGEDRFEEKNDPNSFRLRYGELDGTPIEQWPEGARKYALDDAKDTLRVYEYQQRLVEKINYLAPDPTADPEAGAAGAVRNEREQVYAAFCLHLISCWGMRTDGEAVAKLKAEGQAKHAELRQRMLEQGLFRLERCTPAEVRDGKAAVYGPLTRRRRATKAYRAAGNPAYEVDGTHYYDEVEENVPQRYVRCTEVIQERVAAAFRARGEEPPRNPLTDTQREKGETQGSIKTDRDTLELSGDDILDELGGGGPIATILQTFVPTLERGVELPINTRFQPILNTGRISSADPNLNNIPRGGGVRECFRPRPGFVLSSVDYDCAELRSHAQVNLRLFGKSAAAEFFRGNPQGDPHLELAASILGISVEEAHRRKNAGDKEIKGVRQMCKALNFGLPGGMGANRLVEAARKGYGVIIPPAEAHQRKQQWMARWPEMKWYFDYISSRVGDFEADLEQFRPGPGGVGVRPHRIRGGCGYSDGANCVDAETEALTQRGWLRGHEIQLTDKLLTKNAHTGRLEWQHPTDIIRWPDYEGELMEFSSRSFSAVTTPNHRWLVDTKGGRKSVCVVSEDLSPHGDDRIHRTGIYEGDVHHSDDFIRLIGWFLTDGSIERAGNSSRVRFFQSQRANPQKVAEIDALMARVAPEVRRHVRREHESVVWSLTGPVARELRRLFPERVLTFDFLQTITGAQARLLVDTMVKGDGHRVKNQRFLSCGREEKAHAFQALCTLAGYASRLEYRDMSKYTPRSKLMPNIPKMKGVWLVRILNRERVQVTAAQTRRFHDKREVWCPAVPNTYFVARRRGTTYITGNTLFQGLTADGAKHALCRVSKECYVDCGTALYGSRVVAFLYDELILEVPEDIAHEAAHRQAEVMVSAMQAWLPDVPVTASPALMRRWTKGAEAKYRDGRLVPWDD